jgi:hypothetical protein
MIKLSENSRYYFFSLLTAAIFGLIFIALDIEFINSTFFITAFIWHFTLMAPGVREKIFTSKTRFSFLSITIRVNHYLQLFLPTHKIPCGVALVRAISPLLFTCMLFVVGGSGNLLFTLLGSFIFECVYILINNKNNKAIIEEHINDPEIPPAIPSEESGHE